MSDSPKPTHEASKSSAAPRAEEALPAPGGGETTMEALLSGQDKLQESLQSREVTTVKVVQVLEDRVLVDIGEKLEGVVPRADFLPDGLPTVGQRIAVVLERRGRADQPSQLSHRKAKAVLGWAGLKKAHEAGETVKGRIQQWIKGGYRVDLDGVDAFMPLSQSELRPPSRHRLPVGAKVRVALLEIKEDRQQAVVSRRKLLESEASKRRDDAMGAIKVGQVHRGWISHVTESGILVNLGGVEGLVQNHDIDWKESAKSKERYARGQRINVKVLHTDGETGKVGLGIKQLKPNPADLIKKKFPFKSVVKAKIGPVTEQGAQAHVGSTPAFVPAEEFPEDRPLKEGETVKAVVLGVRSGTFDLKLSAKRYEDIEDRKRMQQYMRKAPPLTLGELLNPTTDTGD